MQDLNLENAGVEELVQKMKKFEKKISRATFDQIKSMLENFLPEELNDDFIRGFFFQPILLEIMKRMEQEKDLN